MAKARKLPKPHPGKVPRSQGGKKIIPDTINLTKEEKADIDFTKTEITVQNYWQRSLAISLPLYTLTFNAMWKRLEEKSIPSREAYRLAKTFEHIRELNLQEYDCTSLYVEFLAEVQNAIEETLPF